MFLGTQCILYNSGWKYRGCPIHTITVLCVDDNLECLGSAVVDVLGGTAAAAPPPFRPGKPALCGSHPLVTPYYCRLGDLLCYSCTLYLCNLSAILCVYAYL